MVGRVSVTVVVGGGGTDLKRMIHKLKKIYNVHKKRGKIENIKLPILFKSPILTMYYHIIHNFFEG